MTPDDYCQDKAAQSAQASTTRSASCRPIVGGPLLRSTRFAAVDNIVDEVSDAAVAQSKLGYWRREIDNLYAGRAEHPVTRALAPHHHPTSYPAVGSPHGR